MKITYGCVYIQDRRNLLGLAVSITSNNVPAGDLKHVGFLIIFVIPQVFSVSDRHALTHGFIMFMFMSPTKKSDAIFSFVQASNTTSMLVQHSFL